MFSLAIYDVLTPGELNGARTSRAPDPGGRRHGGADRRHPPEGRRRAPGRRGVLPRPRRELRRGSRAPCPTACSVFGVGTFDEGLASVEAIASGDTSSLPTPAADGPRRLAGPTAGCRAPPQSSNVAAARAPGPARCPRRAPPGRRCRGRAGAGGIARSRRGSPRRGGGRPPGRGGRPPPAARRRRPRAGHARPPAARRSLDGQRAARHLVGPAMRARRSSRSSASGAPPARPR